jgi:hypothetical protein
MRKRNLDQDPYRNHQEVRQTQDPVHVKIKLKVEPINITQKEAQDVEEAVMKKERKNIEKTHLQNQVETLV